MTNSLPLQHSFLNKMLCGLPLPTDLIGRLKGSDQLHICTALLLPHIANFRHCNASADEPIGLPVTVENREKYVECLYHYFFDCSEQVTFAFTHC